MSGIALIVTTLGLQKQAAAIVKKERLIASICACTRLSFDEVVKKTKGQNLEAILKAAAITGECMSYEEANHIHIVQAITACETGRKASEIEALI